VSNDEDERSEAAGEEANSDRSSLLLLLTGGVLMLLLDGVRVALGLPVKCSLDADLRETTAESDESFLSKDCGFGTSDNVLSASNMSLGRRSCGVSGGAVLCRAIRSRTGEWRSALSFSVSELRALEAALTDIGEGRGEEFLLCCIESVKSALALRLEGFTGLRVREVVSLLELVPHFLYTVSELLRGCSDGKDGFESGRDSSWPSARPWSAGSRWPMPHAITAALLAPGPSAGF